MERIRLKQPWNSQQQPWKLEHNSDCLSKLWAKNDFQFISTHSQVTHQGWGQNNYILRQGSKILLPTSESHQKKWNEATKEEGVRCRHEIWQEWGVAEDSQRWWRAQGETQKSCAGVNQTRQEPATQEQNTRKEDCERGCLLQLYWVFMLRNLLEDVRHQNKVKTKEEQDMRTRKEGIKSRRKSKGISKSESEGKSVQEAWEAASTDGRERRSPESKSGKNQSVPASPHSCTPPTLAPNCHKSPWESVAGLSEQ